MELVKWLWLIELLGEETNGSHARRPGQNKTFTIGWWRCNRLIDGWLGVVVVFLWQVQNWLGPNHDNLPHANVLQFCTVWHSIVHMNAPRPVWVNGCFGGPPSLWQDHQTILSRHPFLKPICDHLHGVFQTPPPLPPQTPRNKLPCKHLILTHIHYQVKWQVFVLRQSQHPPPPHPLFISPLHCRYILNGQSQSPYST